MSEIGFGQKTQETTIKKTLTLDEEDIRKILRDYVVTHHGEEWRNAGIAIYEYTLPVGMGQIDDVQAIEAKFNLVTVANSQAGSEDEK